MGRHMLKDVLTLGKKFSEEDPGEQWKQNQRRKVVSRGVVPLYTQSLCKSPSEGK